MDHHPGLQERGGRGRHRRVSQHRRWGRWLAGVTGASVLMGAAAGISAGVGLPGGSQVGPLQAAPPTSAPLVTTSPPTTAGSPAGSPTSPTPPTTAPARPSRTLSAAPAGAPPLSMSQITGRVDPAVVDISSSFATGRGALGTGMVLTPSGQVVTNDHLIRNATLITIAIPGRGHLYRAAVVGADPAADVALLQIHGVSGLPTVPLGGSTTTVGQPIVAIGNAHGAGGTPAATEGVISAEGQRVNAITRAGTVEHLSGLLQTTALSAPGISGGPLVSSSGQVVGMDTAALAPPPGQPASRVGFAIPSQEVAQVVAQLRAGRA
ncbi:MAG TPA: trypsin-like peptidase domain-containing protein [Acidimicrobiales bacterium]|nr:trypsin-like peptidase domain-containing protein [Acidimicrobiales bacterium]